MARKRRMTKRAAHNELMAHSRHLDKTRAAQKKGKLKIPW